VDFDSTIQVRDLAIPGDVTLLTEPDEVVAKVLPPRIEIEEVPVAAEEGEEGAEAAAEGEAPAAEGGAPAEGGAEEAGSEE
jgi:large subunit ribosomal protein L25